MTEDMVLSEQTELGKKSEYDRQYNPDKLFAIPRQLQRVTINIKDNALPFKGFDIWNHYEVSWLNEKGKPLVAIAKIIYDCNSPNIIESKSLKLYFNSFNNTKIRNIGTLQNMITHDLEKRIGAAVQVDITLLPTSQNETLFAGFDAQCIDDLDVDCNSYEVNPKFLATDNEMVEESLYSNLLKSNCLVTHQPDWASVLITYKGQQINHEGLLRYIVSFRNHNEFHEHCIERIFTDIMQQCNPKQLTVYGRFTRRGGLDINPCRSTESVNPCEMNSRLLRQ